MNSICQFHADHQQVVDALIQLRQEILVRDTARVESLLAGAEGLVGSHFKFQELCLNPAIEPCVGEAYGKLLLKEHHGAFRSTRKIADLVREDSWTGADDVSVLPNLDLIREQPISCEGLSLWIEPLAAEDQENLFQKMLAVRRQGAKLSEYYREPQAA